MNMKTKLPFATAIFLATTKLANAMETTALQQGIFGQNTTQSLVELRPITFKLPDDIYRHFVLECPSKSRIRMRSVNKFTRDTVDKAHEAGKYLEEFVFELILSHKIYMRLHVMDPSQDDASNSDSEGEGPCFEGSYTCVNKLPKDIDELHNWCQNGYQLAEGEEAAHECWVSRTYFMLSIDYSFRLFCYGIHNGCLPLVRYTLDQHNNFWNRKKLSLQLRFDIGKVDYSLSTFLILKDYVHIFDFAIKNQKFCDFTFGTELKNGVGNTPLHTLAKYGKEAMIKRFLKKKKLVHLCLLPENIKGDKGKNPAEIAEIAGQSPEIINLFKAAIEKAEIENAEETTAMTQHTNTMDTEEKVIHSRVMEQHSKSVPSFTIKTQPDIRSPMAASKLVWENAQAYFERISKTTDFKSMDRIGSCYEYGYGVDINLELAAYYYELAALNGNKIAKVHHPRVKEKMSKSIDMLNNSKIYSFMPKDELEWENQLARQEFEEVYREAHSDNINKICRLAVFYENGYGVEKNNELAMGCYKRASALQG